VTRREYQSEKAAARRRFWFRGFHLIFATLLAVLLLVGIVGAIPSRDAVKLLDRGKAELDASRYQRAERNFAEVLSGEPNSLYARVGLACAFMREGHGSRALLELTLALERGLFPFALGDCGDGVGLDERYFAAKYGAVGTFMAPRISPGGDIEELLLKTPPESEDEEARRFLLGACLAFRTGLDAAGWDYAANGAELGVPAHDIGLLPRCLGRGVLARLHCPSVGPPDYPEAPLGCILNGGAGFAYQRQRPYLFPIDRPLAYFP
jgi:hypothetical protein